MTESLHIGQAVPNFTLPGSNGQDVSLNNYRGKKVVIYFYPKDMTPSCTQESCNFRDYHGDFEKHNAVVIGISPDPLKRHAKFIEKHQLPFLLLADEEHQVADLFGVWQLKKNFGKEYYGIVRSTFLIDEEGKLVQEWRAVKVKGHTEAVLQAVKS
ncbi:thioredoxin-dependent thiol peroxidase [Paenibacillus marinisediminis]